MNRSQLAQEAMREASRLRAQHRVGPADAICPFDFAQACGLSVQLQSLSSLEGMYAADQSAIFVGNERPAGRRRFTCAHELGHHVFDHGTRFDQLGVDGSPPEEFLANSFAASLLMPKVAVDAAINRRGWGRRPLQPQMVFELAQDLGVGYTTLLTHLSIVLRYLSGAQAALLEGAKLPDIRQAIAGRSVPYDVFVIDEHWGARPLDVEVGDLVVVAGASVEGSCVQFASSGPHLAAVQPGIGSLKLPSGREIGVRASRREYSGRAQFRHEPDVEDSE